MPARAEARIANELKAAPRAAMPTNVRPMLATLVDEPFDRDGWLFEVKFDGYRAIAEVQRGNVRLYSRNLLSFNERFAPITQTLERFKHAAVLDGEIVALDPTTGCPRFQLLQHYQSERKGVLTYYVFDLLHLDGHDLCRLPLVTRKAILADLLPRRSNLFLSEHVERDGIAFFRATAEVGLEGMVAKKGASIYRPGVRSRDWLKMKARRRQEAVIGGFTRPRGSRKYFGSLLLGVYERGRLQYVGHVGTGFDEQSLTQIHARLVPLIQKECPFETKPKTNTPATWVRPELVCEIEFTEWTGDALMRHPVFMGLRDDKSAPAVKREAPAHI